MDNSTISAPVVKSTALKRSNRTDSPVNAAQGVKQYETSAATIKFSVGTALDSESGSSSEEDCSTTVTHEKESGASTSGGVPSNSEVSLGGSSQVTTGRRVECLAQGRNDAANTSWRPKPRSTNNFIGSSRPPNSKKRVTKSGSISGESCDSLKVRRSSSISVSTSTDDIEREHFYGDVDVASDSTQTDDVITPSVLGDATSEVASDTHDGVDRLSDNVQTNSDVRIENDDVIPCCDNEAVGFGDVKGKNDFDKLQHIAQCDYTAERGYASNTAISTSDQSGIGEFVSSTELTKNYQITENVSPRSMQSSLLSAAQIDTSCVISCNTAGDEIYSYKDISPLNYASPADESFNDAVRSALISGLPASPINSSRDPDLHPDDQSIDDAVRNTLISGLPASPINSPRDPDLDPDDQSYDDAKRSTLISGIPASPTNLSRDPDLDPDDESIDDAVRSTLISGLPASPVNSSRDADINQDNGPESDTVVRSPSIHNEQDSSNVNDKNQDSNVDDRYAERLAEMRKERFNPFNKETSESENGMERSLRSQTMESGRSNSTWSSGPDDHQSLISEASSGFPRKSSLAFVLPEADFGVNENHFSLPDGHFGLSSTEEIQVAIETCKEMIRSTQPHTDRQKDLVGKLVQLRLRLAESKDIEPTQAQEKLAVESHLKNVLGHQFRHRTSGSSKHYCEKCCSVIWGLMQRWYKCTECGFCVHDKCLNQVIRTCANQKILESPTYILSICLERGLAAQSFRCAECRGPISFKSIEPRQCDYTGSFYCEQCHWNDLMVIPARVVHNWDLEPRKVGRASKQFLKLMQERSILRIQDLNPMLFNFVDELNEVKRLREEILVMKKYFLSCPAALKSKLLLQLQDRQHFVENSDMYSLQDLIDVSTDRLIPNLVKIHASFAQHIKTDCPKCQAKGYICELCTDKEVLFPFDSIATVCPNCSTVLHRHCFEKKQRDCPRCNRKKKMTDSD